MTEKTAERENGNKAQPSSLTLRPAQTQLLLREMFNLTIITDVRACLNVCVSQLAGFMSAFLQISNEEDNNSKEPCQITNPLNFS